MQKLWVEKNKLKDGFSVKKKPIPATSERVPIKPKPAPQPVIEPDTQPEEYTPVETIEKPETKNDDEKIEYFEPFKKEIEEKIEYFTELTDEKINQLETSMHNDMTRLHDSIDLLLKRNGNPVGASGKK